MPELCDLQIHVNGQQTFFINQIIISKFSEKIRKIIKQEKSRTQIRNAGIAIDDFPGGPDGFELVSRFCYNNGAITITASNVSLLHCCALFIEMTERVSKCNLLHQTEAFLEGMFCWSLPDILTCLKSCESFVLQADSCGLIERLMCSLLAKIAQNSELNSSLFASSPSSFSSSPETAFRLSSSTKTTRDQLLTNPSTPTKAWWFKDMTILPPVIIERFVNTLGVYGTHNNSLILTRFLLHYLKTASPNSKVKTSKSSYGGLADTAVYGVISMGKNAFSCRAMFWVLRIVSSLGLSRDCRGGLERLISGVLDEAKLDDLLVSGHDTSVYDVNLVLRLIRLFVHNYDQGLCSLEKMNKVGGLIDKYLREIAPDHNLKISKFLGVAESLPDEARNCFDEVYRAVDIYLESHPCISMEERSRLCRCLNHEKLSLEACKDLGKNTRIPPAVTVKALASQHSKISTKEKEGYHIPVSRKKMINSSNKQLMGVYNNNRADEIIEGYNNIGEKDEMMLNLERMQWRVVELEKVCNDIKGQMSRMEKSTSRVDFTSSSPHRSTFPRLC